MEKPGSLPHAHQEQIGRKLLSHVEKLRTRRIQYPHKGIAGSTPW